MDFKICSLSSHVSSLNFYVKLLYFKVLSAVSLYTAVSRKVVGKSARDKPERYCGWFLVHCFSNKFKEWHERPWMYVCEGERKATKVGSTATVSRTSVLIISHITFRDCRVHSFCDNLSRNSCIRSLAALYQKLIIETLGGSIRRLLHTTKGLL